MNTLGYVRYEFVDFHEVVRTTRYDALNPYINKYASVLDNFSFYAEVNGKVIQQQ